MRPITITFETETNLQVDIRDTWIQSIEDIAVEFLEAFHDDECQFTLDPEDHTKEYFEVTESGDIWVGNHHFPRKVEPFAGYCERLGLVY